jgi:NAD(P)-dependent dehydrogenase (short-subunit alcohol dehydrogenase family)
MSTVGRIALITGANKGIGFEIARQLGAQGITILAGVRDEVRGAVAVDHLLAEGIDAKAVRLDVTNQTTIDAAVTWIDQNYGRLDILVNNAGMSTREGSTPPSQLTLEAVRDTFATNVFGVFALTKALLPLLRRSDAGRIVNLSSEMGSLTISSDPSSFAAYLPPTLATMPLKPP